MTLFVLYFELNPKSVLIPQYKLKINNFNSINAIWITMEIMKYV